MAKTQSPNDILAMFKGIFQGLGIGFGYILISMSIISNIVKDKELNLKNQMRISGVSLPAYWISHYLSDVIFGMITTSCILILIAVYKASVPGAWVLILLMNFTNPIFLYCMSTFFSQSNLARNGVLFLYLFIGVLVPFILPLIQLINQDVFDVVQVIQYLIMMFPVFASVNGYIKIALRLVQYFAWTTYGGDNKPPQMGIDDIQPFDYFVARSNLGFLCASFVFFWLVLLIIESRILGKCCNRAAQNVAG